MGCQHPSSDAIILAEEPLLALFGKFKRIFTRSLMLEAVGVYIMTPQA
jgi:hypothetical protein